jgi:Fe-S-cluster containining protein
LTGSTDPVAVLRSAVRAGLDPILALARFRTFQERFHAAYAETNPVSCAPGCSACCQQMVFDVTPVEVEDLGRHLRRADRAEGLLGRLRERRDRFDRIRLDHPRDSGESDDAWIERVALAFWREGIGCAFLDEDGACSVHDHRPQACRRFFVHGSAELCNPDDAASDDRRARMVEPGSADEVDRLLLAMSAQVAFDPEDDRLDHAMVRWLENRSRD